MEYELKVDNESEKELEISVPAEKLNNFIENQVDKLHKKVSLKGFRKGRVPKNLIKTHYQDTIKANAINDLLAESYQTILKEKKWQPASPAQLVNWEEGEKIKFHLRIEIIPDFLVDNYLGLEIFKEKPLPIDYLLAQTINELRENSATMQEIPGPAVVDNFITLDLETIENHRIKKHDTDITIKIGDRNFPDEINRALVGAKKGQRIEVKVSDLIYQILVKKIEEKLRPQIDDNFARTLNYENVEALKKKIMDDLKKREEQRIEEESRESLANVILERVHFNPPKSLITEEYQEIIKKNNLPDSDANKERFWSFAEKRVRFNLILDKIAQQEGIKTDDEEIMKLIEKMGLSLNDENQLEIINYFRNILNRRKTIDFLFKNARISEKGRIISPKEVNDANRAIRH